MGGRREFVPRLARPRNLAVCAALCVMAVASHAGTGSIDARPFARAYVPGELVRFEVVADVEVVELTGTFRGVSLAFSRAPQAPHEPRWVAWGVIPLDAAPGTATYRLAAKTATGASIATGGEIVVAAKDFPEQRLNVESKFVNPPASAAKRIAREKKRLGAVYAQRTALPPPSSPFERPVPGEPTSEFGTRRIFNGEPRAPHPGLDLRAAPGTPVVAAGPGKVALAMDLYYSGGTVIVDHGGGLFTVYAHLSKITAKEGASVKAGDLVGLSGATGRVTGPHLHWGARVGDAIFDPRALLDPRLFGPAE